MNVHRPREVNSSAVGMSLLTSLRTHVVDAAIRLRPSLVWSQP